MDNVDAIITADWHLRDSTPVCRTDNFWETQWKKVDFISNLQKEYNCPVIHAGDLFDYWKASPYLLREALQRLPDRFYTIYGNHDLPEHNLKLHGKSGVDVLIEAGKVKLLPGVHWEQEAGNNPSIEIKGRKILVMHAMTYDLVKPWAGIDSPPARKLLKQYPQFDLIIVGHNHQSFVVEDKDRVLVSPGAITRQVANKDENKPRVYLWNAETNILEDQYLPCDSGAVSREHLEETKERDNRISAFVERLQGDWEIKTSFEENLRIFLDENKDKIRNSVKNIIMKSMEVER